MRRLLIWCDEYETRALAETLKMKFDVYRRLKVEGLPQFSLWKNNTESEKKIREDQLPKNYDVLIFHGTERVSVEKHEPHIQFNHKFLFSSAEISMTERKFSKKNYPSIILIPKIFKPGTSFLSADEVMQIWKFAETGNEEDYPNFCIVQEKKSPKKLQILFITLHVFLAAWQSKYSKQIEQQNEMLQTAINLIGLNIDLSPVDSQIYEWTQTEMFRDLLCAQITILNQNQAWVYFEEEINREYNGMINNNETTKFTGTKELLKKIGLGSYPQGDKDAEILAAAVLIELSKLITEPILSDESLTQEKMRHEINHTLLKSKLLIDIDGLVAELNNGDGLGAIKDDIKQIISNLGTMITELNSFVRRHKLAMSPSNLVHNLFPNLNSEPKTYIESVLNESWLYRCSIDSKLTKVNNAVSKINEELKHLDKTVKSYEEKSHTLLETISIQLINMSNNLHILTEHLSTLNADGYLYRALQ